MAVYDVGAPAVRRCHDETRGRTRQRRETPMVVAPVPSFWVEIRAAWPIIEMRRVESDDLELVFAPRRDHAGRCAKEVEGADNALLAQLRRYGGVVGQHHPHMTAESLQGARQCPDDIGKAAGLDQRE